MMGGRAAVLAAAKKAAGEGDHQWAAELTTHLITIDNDDREAKLLKTEALRQIGFTHSNNNWRNWYLTSAQELKGIIDFSNATDLASPDLLRAFPTSELINGLRFRLMAEETLDVQMTFGFNQPDINEGLGLEIRRGVAEFHESLPDHADVILEMDRSVLESILLGEVEMFHQGIDPPHPETPQAALIAAFQAGKARLSRGTLEDFKKFFSYFEPPSTDPVPLTVR
jgi:alkyl sulfatase BDS1-like metallo-beta-lactamase superfamily hydrolase